MSVDILPLSSRRWCRYPVLHYREKACPELDTPIPKASYTVLKDKQIRDLLATHDLSIFGDRSQLIARHERSV